MNTKKILASLLALAMIFTLAACGAGKKGDDKKGTSSSLEGPIQVITREAGSGTRGAFVEIVGVLNGKDDATVKTAQTQNGTNDVLTTVQGSKEAIGYIALGSLNDTVKALKINGVEASEENVKKGDYKIQRPFNFCYQDGKLSDIAKDFLTYVLSAEGQEFAKEKWIPVDDKAPSYEKKDNLKGDINITGSTSVYPLMEKIVEGYTKLNPNVKINLQQNGSGEGIKAAIEGTADFGMASRELKAEEAEKLKAEPIAKDGIAVIVNKENPLDEISMDVIKEIYLGNTKDWKDVK